MLTERFVRREKEKGGTGEDKERDRGAIDLDGG